MTNRRGGTTKGPETPAASAAWTVVAVFVAMGCLFTFWIYGYCSENASNSSFCNGDEVYIPFAGFVAAVIAGGLAFWGAPRRWVVALLGIAVLLGASLWLWY